MRTSTRFLRHALPVALVGLGAACATHAAPGAPTPEAAVGALPPIPAASGALKLDVVAPGEGEALPTRDSTFIYGSLGTGQATLTIDGAPVKVEPNGTFLAWLPVPATGVYRLQAAANGQTTALERHVRLPAGGTSLPRDRARILEGTAYPSGALVVQPGERIDVGFRGTPGAQAWLVLPDGSRVPLVESAAVQQATEGVAEFGGNQSAGARPLAGVSSYSGYFIARPLLSAEPGPEPRITPAPRLDIAAPPPPAPDTLQMSRAAEERARARGAVDVDTPQRIAAIRPGRGPGGGDTAQHILRTRLPNGLTAPRAAGAAVLELVVGNDTARTPLPLTVAVLDRPRAAVTAAPPADQTHSGMVVARPSTTGPYTWFWPTGTRLALTGERGNMLRVALADGRAAWVNASDVRLLPEGTPPGFTKVGTVKLTPQAGWIDARLAISQRVPFKVDETLSSITLTLYGAQSETDFMQTGKPDPLLRYVEWRQEADSIYTLTLHLARSVWGYQTFFTPDGDLVLRVRRPPQIDPNHPLRGLKIVLDPGHPPGGAIGPTRYTEAEANLAIAQHLRPLLEREGATVIMTRTGPEAVALNLRPLMAENANADILLSIHNNGLPNGVNPFGNTGTSDYYFHPRSAELAQDLDREIVRELGTLDLGVGRADLALVRPTWMPAVLTETMYLMVPQQEAALKNPDVQERIARAHVRGLQEFLRARALETRR